ncbi:LysR family transcriptional regulator [Vibrio sp. 1CM2L]|nr:LysR family transcriptional regulator [Vibrio coralliirubri]MCK8075877.1 LysR family transcriptional regulator [Vibrio sp. 1CM2L]
MQRLLTFVSVYEKKTFRNASDSLNVSLATVSRHIKWLEDDINKKLFIKTTSGAIPTPDGDALYIVIKKYIGEICGAVEKFKSDKHIITYVHPHLFQDSMVKYLYSDSMEQSCRYFELQPPSSRDMLIEMLKYGELDFAIDYVASNDPAIESIESMPVDLSIYGSRKFYSETLFCVKDNQFKVKDDAFSIDDFFYVKHQWLNYVGELLNIKLGVDCDSNIGSICLSKKSVNFLVCETPYLSLFAKTIETESDIFNLSDDYLSQSFYILVSRAKLKSKPFLEGVISELRQKFCVS